MKENKRLKIQYVRSSIGCPQNQKQLVRSLGLRKLNQVVDRPDSPAVRGIVARIPHLVHIIGGEKS